MARRWWISYLILVGLLGLWLVATPPLASPDEPAHLIRAASVARGTLLGTTTGRPGPRTSVYLPAPFADVDAYPVCFAFHAEVPASCTPALRRDIGSEKQVTTAAGKYPPFYYAMVGAPSLLVSGVAADIPVRIVSGLLCAALLSTAAAWATHPGGGMLSLAMVVAVSPMVLFMASVVNPNGMEIAAAIAVWLGLLTLVGSGERSSTGFLVTLTAMTSVLLAARPVSVLWTALLMVVVLLLAPAGRLSTLAKDRRVQVSVAVLSVVTIASAAWVLSVQSHALNVAAPAHPDVSFGAALLTMLHPSHVKDLAIMSIGNFGWLDTPAPKVTLLLWALVVVAVVVVGLVMSSWRHRAVTALGVALCIFVPAVGEALAYPRIGYWWQGRYTLPLEVGIPLLAVAGARLNRRTRLFLGSFVAAAAAVAQVLAYVKTLARYTVGHGGGLGLGTIRWHPPLPPLLLIALFTLMALAWSTWLLLPSINPRNPRARTLLVALSR